MLVIITQKITDYLNNIYLQINNNNGRKRKSQKVQDLYDDFSFNWCYVCCTNQKFKQPSRISNTKIKMS